MSTPGAVYVREYVESSVIYVLLNLRGKLCVQIHRNDDDVSAIGDVALSVCIRPLLVFYKKDGYNLFGLALKNALKLTERPREAIVTPMVFPEPVHHTYVCDELYRFTEADFVCEYYIPS